MTTIFLQHSLSYDTLLGPSTECHSWRAENIHICKALQLILPLFKWYTLLSTGTQSELMHDKCSLCFRTPYIFHDFISCVMCSSDVARHSRYIAMSENLKHVFPYVGQLVCFKIFCILQTTQTIQDSPAKGFKYYSLSTAEYSKNRT